MGSILPCRLPFGNAGGLQILRCQGFEVKYYDVTLDALTLKPSDVCNVGFKSAGQVASIHRNPDWIAVFFCFNRKQTDLFSEFWRVY